MVHSRSTPVVAILGCTAVGKSALSLDLAERLDGEVINCDSMQVYRGMDIGTAKVPPAERRGVAHHLLDILEVPQTLTVAEFQGWARGAIEDVKGRGRTPILVGGSALYLRAVLDVFDFPGTDEQIRRRWEERLAEVGPAALHAELAHSDPAAAADIDPDNGRRIVRALEVGEMTGESFTATLPRMEYHHHPTIQLGLSIDRPTLDDRIAHRTELMYSSGLIEEVQRLLVKGLDHGLTASRAIGYREAAAVVSGELTRQEAIERTATATRRFARRQQAWWRRDDRIEWLPWDLPDLVEQAGSRVRDSLSE